jgi:hypothetical protein
MASLGATASSPMPKAPKVVSWLGIIGPRLISFDEVAARIASYIARGEILVGLARRDRPRALRPRTDAARGDLRRAATSSASAT